MYKTPSVDRPVPVEDVELSKNNRLARARENGDKTAVDDPQGLEYVRRHYIETFGKVAAQNALPAIAGRFAGILDLTPNPVSFSALQRELGVSRPGISTNTRLLEYLGAIVRITIKGQRENVFISSPNVNVPMSLS